MNQPVTTQTIEPRWPVIITILAVLLLLAGLPGRIKFFPAWVPYTVVAAVLVPIVAIGLASARGKWLQIERTATLLFCSLVGCSTFLGLLNLIFIMINRSREVSGLQLLASSVAIWVINVLVFSLLFWQIDRGGPEARTNNKGGRPDWLFPQEGAPPEDFAPDWRPVYVDYLYLGFNTATAFSPTDALPLTPRAKLLMMLQSSISLMTIVVVASRAINILGS